MRECIGTSPKLGRVAPEQVWDEAEPLIAKALEGSGDNTQEVLAKIAVGDACILASDEVFAVVGVEHQSDGPALIIWAVASRGGKVNHAELYEELETVGRTVKAVRLICWTTRLAGDRTFPAAGWHIGQTCWLKELSPCRVH